MGLFNWCLSGGTWRWSKSPRQTGQEFYEMETGEVCMCLRVNFSFNCSKWKVKSHSGFHASCLTLWVQVPPGKAVWKPSSFQGWCDPSSERKGQKSKGKHQTPRNWGLFQPFTAPCSLWQLLLCMEEVSYYGPVLNCFLWVPGALRQLPDFLCLH